MPYAPTSLFDYRSNIPQMLLRAGENQASAQRETGERQAALIGGLGKIAGGAINDYAERKRLEPGLKAAEAERAFKLKREQAAFADEEKVRAKQLKREEALKLPHRQEALAALQADPEGQKELISSFNIMDDYEDSMLGEAAAGVIRHGFSPEAVKVALAELGDKLPPAKVQRLQEIAQGDPAEGEKAIYQMLSNSPQQKHQQIFSQIQAKQIKDAEILRETNRDKMTAEDRKADNERARLTFEETRRHNKAVEAANAAKASAGAGGGNDDVSLLLTGGTADKIPMKGRAAAVAEAKKSGGIDGTGFVPMNNQQQTKFSDLMDLRQKAERLAVLLENAEVSSKLGPGAGRWTSWTKELPGLGASTEVKEAFDLLGNLSDSELRKRSGAATAKDEYDRILGFTVDARKQPDSNKANLKQMLKSVNGALRRMGADRLPDPDGELVKGTTVQAPAPKEGFSVVAPDGQTYSFPNAAAMDGFKKRARIK